MLLTEWLEQILNTLENIIRISESVFNKKSIIKEKNPDNISIRNPSNKKAKELNDIINERNVIQKEEKEIEKD